MIEKGQNFYLVFEDLGVLYEAFVNDFDASFRVGGLLKSGLINSSVTSTSNRLYEEKCTL